MSIALGIGGRHPFGNFMSLKNSEDASLATWEIFVYGTGVVITKLQSLYASLNILPYCQE